MCPVCAAAANDDIHTSFLSLLISSFPFLSLQQLIVHSVPDTNPTTSDLNGFSVKASSSKKTERDVRIPDWTFPILFRIIFRNVKTNTVSKICVQRPPLGPQNSVRCWQVVVVLRSIV